jgi:hypothetical protein
MATTPEAQAADAASHAASQAVVHGNVKASSILTPSKAEIPAPAGEYKLKVIWNEIISKAGEAKQFVRHVPGDIVTLAGHDAERLLRHGCVTPTDDEQASSTAANVVTPVDKAIAINAGVGADPVKDAAAAPPTS